MISWFCPRLTLSFLNVCPAGGDCLKGGADVMFPIGEWHVSDSMKVLTSCPLGHQLINSSPSTSYGTFLQDKQQCAPCKQNKYIVDQLEQCQTCPTGAVCNGETGAFTGSAGSHWQREGDRIHVHWCDVGYIMVRNDDTNGQKASQDVCVKCLAGSYSVLGAAIVGLGPCVRNDSLASRYQCAPVGSGHVVSLLSNTTNGAWTLVPNQAQMKCYPCPAGMLD
jgi:hypothetical protein